jgi:hypothetical protein
MYVPTPHIFLISRRFSSQQGVIPAIPSTHILHIYSILTMVNWKDPDLEAKLEVLSVQLLYAVLGLYG